MLENMLNTILSMGTKDVVNLGHLQHFQGSVSSKWQAKLYAEVEDLVLLANLEQVACKAQLQALKLSLEERCRTQLMLRHSVHTTLFEESEDLNALAGEEMQRQSSRSLSEAPPVLEVAKPCSPMPAHCSAHPPTFDLGSEQILAPTKSAMQLLASLCLLEFDAILQKKKATKCLQDQHLKHKAEFLSL